MSKFRLGSDGFLRNPNHNPKDSFEISITIRNLNRTLSEFQSDSDRLPIGIPAESIGMRWEFCGIRSILIGIPSESSELCSEFRMALNRIMIGNSWESIGLCSEFRGRGNQSNCDRNSEGIHRSDCDRNSDGIHRTLIWIPTEFIAFRLIFPSRNPSESDWNSERVWSEFLSELLPGPALAHQHNSST